MLVFEKKAVPKFPRINMPARSQNSVWAWSGGRKAYTELTEVRKINFGPLLRQQGFFRFSHSTRQQEVSCWEEGILQSQVRIQKPSKWQSQRNPGLPATDSESARTESYLQGTHWPIFCEHSFMEKRSKEWKYITQKCRPHRRRSVLTNERNPSKTNLPFAKGH